jgi:hypothetical protein
LTAQKRHARLNAPPIDFELRFTGAARPDATAESRERRAVADEVRLAET